MHPSDTKLASLLTHRRACASARSQETDLRPTDESPVRESFGLHRIEGLLAAECHLIDSIPPRRVLVIEDELSVAEDLTGIILDMGHKVVGVTATFEHALSVFQHEAPDLVLSDIQLADGSSGIRAIDIILESRPKTPVIYVTGFPELLSTAKEPEPTYVIQKPYSKDEVRAAVVRATLFS